MYFVKKAVVFVFVLLFFTSVKLVSAQVVINEFSSATSDNDWVEIYNNSDDEIGLFNYSLVDGSRSGNTKTFSCILAPYGFVVVNWSNRLNNTRDIIRLKNNDLIVDCVAYGNGANQVCEGTANVDLADISVGQFGVRVTDGNGDWQIVPSATQDGPNTGGQKDAGAICMTPTPSFTTTPTLRLTSTPRPTRTNTPTPKPTKTIGPKPVVKSAKATALPTRKVKPQDNSENVEKSRAVLDAVRKGSDEDENENGEGEDKKLPVSAIILIVVGIGFIGTSIYLMVAKYKNRYNLKGEEKTTEKEIEL